MSVIIGTLLIVLHQTPPLDQDHLRPNRNFAKPAAYYTPPTIRLGSNGNYVKTLQNDLNSLDHNFNDFAIDGVYGPKTQQCVGNYQDLKKLPRNGIVGPSTWKALINDVKAIQNHLNILGYKVGTPDGEFNQLTIAAIKRFQAANGLYADGFITPRTRWAMFNPHAKNVFAYRQTSTSISSLQPYVAALAHKLIDSARRMGLDVRVTTAFRSWNEEDRLYDSGRTRPGPIVTDVRGGASFHNWGLAFDAVPYVNGAVSGDMRKFRLMGKLGTQLGLEWGGNFKDILDLSHFQYTFGLTTQDLLEGKKLRRWP